MFSILPFEVPFFEQRHDYPVHYVGNPTANEVAEFLSGYKETKSDFCQKNQLDDKPLIALLPGSRMQEINANLPMMIETTRHLLDSYTLVVAGAPSISDEVYRQYIDGTDIRVVRDATFPLLAHAKAALVTSGTATLETCCFSVPQVVLYKTPLPRLTRWLWDSFFKVKYISLVNLIADREVVSEMMADRFTASLIREELNRILPGEAARQTMLEGYRAVQKQLGDTVASDNAARIMCRLLRDGRV